MIKSDLYHLSISPKANRSKEQNDIVLVVGSGSTSEFQQNVNSDDI